MPAPGEQHLNSGGKQIINPFEEVRPRISEYTAQEIATLQSKLEKQLGPEYISSRAGPGGGKVHYVAAEKCIQLANEVFGFNGWSSQIKEVTVDYVEINPTSQKVDVGLSVIVRVTLRDGTFHEDIGYGHIENCKTKAAAFEKAKKEGTTDALKRALRSFGNVLGNCIYDKEYLSKVTKVKVPPSKWNVDNLHRHADHALIKKELEAPKSEEKSQIMSGPSILTEESLEDEFGEFDEADFSVPDPDAHPDEVVLPPPPPASHHFSNIRNGNNSNGAPTNPNRPPINRQQHTRPPSGAQGHTSGSVVPQPQTPNSGFQRSTSGAGQMRPPQDTGPPRPVQAVIAGRALNQPSRTGPPSAPASPARLIASSDSDSTTSLPPQGAGFFSARAATMIPEGATHEAIPPHINNLPAFNPHLESPSIRKTPGVDHKSSKPTTRDLKHVPTSSQAITTGPGAGRGNLVNPQLDATRRIGVPGGASPMANRGSYKPPTMKRPADATGGGGANRTPLVDLPANGAIIPGEGGDVKRQRLNG